MTNIYQDISPDGRLLALSGMRVWDDGADTVTLTDMRTGEIVKTYDIHNPYAWENMVSFYDDTHLMLLCKPERLGAAFVYLIEVDLQTGKEGV